MSTNVDFIQCAVVNSAGMMDTVVNGTLNTFIFVLSCHILTTFVYDGIIMCGKEETIQEETGT